jgi:hypothetical protein
MRLGVIGAGFRWIMSKFMPVVESVVTVTPLIQRQNATIYAQRARSRYLEYRKGKSQRRNWGHWRP